MSDGRWGLAAFSKSIKVNKTAFSPGSGTRQDLLDYLYKIATRFKGGILS
jgi:hypothetical protein